MSNNIAFAALKKNDFHMFLKKYDKHSDSVMSEISVMSRGMILGNWLKSQTNINNKKKLIKNIVLDLYTSCTNFKECLYEDKALLDITLSYFKNSKKKTNVEYNRFLAAGFEYSFKKIDCDLLNILFDEIKDKKLISTETGLSDENSINIKCARKYYMANITMEYFNYLKQTRNYEAVFFDKHILQNAIESLDIDTVSQKIHLINSKNVDFFQTILNKLYDFEPDNNPWVINKTEQIIRNQQMIVMLEKQFLSQAAKNQTEKSKIKFL